MKPPPGPDDSVEPPADVSSCPATRELISADADDALDAVAARALDRHVASCSACAAYRSQVADLARTVRVRAAAFDPTFVEAVMLRSQPARLGRGGWLRPALAWCGLLIAFQSVVPLAIGELDGAPTHVARHVGASTFALAVGLLYVAWRPHRAGGMLPLVGALFGAMLVGAVLDVAGGDRSVLSETAHAGELVGMVLLWMIAGSPGRDRVERALRFRRDGGVAPSTS